MVRRVALAGYMGVGKSTVARALGALWHCETVDLDAAIVAAHGSIAEQFKRDGESVFRVRETQALRDVLARHSGELILALGGGALLSAANRRALRDAGVCTIYLRMPLWLGWSRVSGDADRPLLKGGYPAYRARFEVRRRVYRSCDRIVDVYPGTPEQVAGRIFAALPRRVITASF